jgi:hypothetical protein
MVDRLDDLIALAAPPLTAGRQALLSQIVAETQLVSAARRLRRRRRWCGAASTLLVAVGVGVGVATAGHRPPVFHDGSGAHALRILSPMGAGRLCEVSFTATSQAPHMAGERSPDAALTAAGTFLHSLDPASISESVRAGFAAYDESTAETAGTAATAEHQVSATDAFATATQKLQESARAAVARAGLRADDLYILPSVQCASVPR